MGLERNGLTSRASHTDGSLKTPLTGCSQIFVVEMDILYSVMPLRQYYEFYEFMPFTTIDDSRREQPTKTNF